MNTNRLVSSSARALASTNQNAYASGAGGATGFGTAQKGSGYMSRVIPWNEHMKYDSHRSKVLSLYKKCMRTTKDWCFHARSLEVEIWEMTMLRQRFEKHKNETDMVKATALLKAGEEEWWVNRHHNPFLYPYEDGGISANRWDKYKRTGDNYRMWGPEDRAKYPDMMEKLEKLAEIRQESWDSEMARLDAHEAELEERGETLTDSLPAAENVDGLPPFWWKHATRGFERYEPMQFDYHAIDKYKL